MDADAFDEVAKNKHEHENGAAAAKKILEADDEVSKEDVEIRRLLEERKNTSKGDKQRMKDLSREDKKMHKRQEKNEKARKGIKNIPGIKSAKRRILITKMKKAKSLHQEKELPMSLENFTASCMMTINMMKHRWNPTKMRRKTT